MLPHHTLVKIIETDLGAFYRDSVSINLTRVCPPKNFSLLARVFPIESSRSNPPTDCMNLGQQGAFASLNHILCKSCAVDSTETGSSGCAPVPCRANSNAERHTSDTRAAAKMKYVLVSGGVISGIGKGVIASSTGLLLKTAGLKVTSIKVDPYMNVDAGTMAPTEHGEVFVLDDGGEVDLDLGNYERYLSITLTRENNITTGKIYKHVIERERKGDYLGKTVQVVPHVTDAIVDWIQRVARIPVDETNETPDVCIVELGGTVGDIESAPFIEAMRQLKRRAGKDNFLQIHVSLVPVIQGEQKTKPTQAAIKEVRSAGLAPDLVC
jgi:hypothetical protein